MLPTYALRVPHQGQQLHAQEAGITAAAGEARPPPRTQTLCQRANSHGGNPKPDASEPGTPNNRYAADSDEPTKVRYGYDPSQHFEENSQPLDSEGRAQVQLLRFQQMEEIKFPSPKDKRPLQEQFNNLG